MGIERYWQIKHREFNDVLLNTAVVVGYMGGGKSELVNAIIYQINKTNKKFKPINIVTRDFGEVFQLHRPYYSEVLEELKDAEIINLFIDDALTSLHSIKRKRELDIDFASIRHYFRALLNGGDPSNPPFYYDGRGATLNVFFVTQRYQLLAPFQREVPVFIAKAIDLNPTHNPKDFFYNFLGAEAIAWLRENAYRVHILKDKEAMSKFLLKPLGRRPIIVSFKPKPKLKYFVLNYAKRKEWEKREKKVKKVEGDIGGVSGRGKEFLNAVAST